MLTLALKSHSPKLLFVLIWICLQKLSWSSSLSWNLFWMIALHILRHGYNKAIIKTSLFRDDFFHEFAILWNFHDTISQREGYGNLLHNVKEFLELFLNQSFLISPREMCPMFSGYRLRVRYSCYGWGLSNGWYFHPYLFFYIFKLKFRSRFLMIVSWLNSKVFSGFQCEVFLLCRGGSITIRFFPLLKITTQSSILGYVWNSLDMQSFSIKDPCLVMIDLSRGSFSGRHSLLGGAAHKYWDGLTTGCPILLRVIISGGWRLG